MCGRVGLGDERRGGENVVDEGREVWGREEEGGGGSGG